MRVPRAFRPQRHSRPDQEGLSGPGKRKHHPDGANPGDKKAEANFKEVQNAYDILSDPEKKSALRPAPSATPPFDSGNPFGPRVARGSEWAARQSGGGRGRIRRTSTSRLPFFRAQLGWAGQRGRPQEQAGGGIFDEIISRMKGGERGRHAVARRPIGSPEAAEAAITIPFLTAVRGGETSIELQARRRPDRGQTKVLKIPAGIDSGAKIRLKGPGRPVAPEVDLIITVTDRPASLLHPRTAGTSSVDVPISVAEAILEAKGRRA